jgi:GntR family transcriptional regulator
MIHLDYRDARPIYSQIEGSIREQILAGILRPGDKLPSVRELAATLTINPNTIQRAYRDLEQQGWIATVSGKGCFVCDKTPTREKEPLLAQFDQAAAALLAMGMNRQELLARLEKEE